MKTIEISESHKKFLKWYLDSSYIVVSQPFDPPVFINTETSSGETFSLDQLLDLYNKSTANQ